MTLQGTNRWNDERQPGMFLESMQPTNQGKEHTDTWPGNKTRKRITNPGRTR